MKRGVVGCATVFVANFVGACFCQELDKLDDT